MVKTPIIGVLALQGDFLEHITTLQSLGIQTREVRLPSDLDDIDGIIFPGGESTTMANLMDVFAFRKPLTEKIANGLPVWGTCAGMILLARTLVQDRPEPLKLMDITVSRNAFGRQIDSFETELVIKGLEKPMHATFIRAPLITKVGKGVEILSKLEDPSASFGKAQDEGSGQAGTIVAAREKNMLVTSFHPELTKDTRLHEYFLTMSLRGTK